jgi:ketosteroid isomerase-like protein
MDLEARMAVIAEHIRCELSRDLDGALATMAAEPVYEFYPYRLRISGEIAVTEMWERLLAIPPVAAVDRDNVVKQVFVSDDAVVMMQDMEFTTETGEKRRARPLAIYHFADGKIDKETAYFDCEGMRYMDVLLDEEFRSLPGVEEI